MGRKKIELNNDTPVEDIREASGMSQRELATAIGVAHTWVHKAEKRGHRVQLGTLVDVADAAGYELHLTLRSKPEEG